MSEEAALVVLAAGDTAYVFEPDDTRIDTQALVLIAANLDVERFRLPAATFDGPVAAALRADGHTIVDCRLPPALPEGRTP